MLFGAFVNNQLISVLYSIPLVCVSAFRQGLYCINQYSFVAYLKAGIVCLQFRSVFSDCSISGLLCFCTSFRIIFYVPGTLGDCTEYADCISKQCWSSKPCSLYVFSIFTVYVLSNFFNQCAL
jgi:hypothetical protein